MKPDSIMANAEVTRLLGLKATNLTCRPFQQRALNGVD